MEDSTLTTSTGKFWHYNPIGTGMIFTYCSRRKRIIIVCEHTAQVIDIKDIEGSYKTKADFTKSAKEVYLKLIQDGLTLNFDYMDNPTIVGNIGVDFKILEN